MKRVLAVLLICLLIAGFAAGCGKNASEDDKVDNTADKVADDKEEKEDKKEGEDSEVKEVKIEFFNMKREIIDIVAELINGFQDENPGVTIEQNAVPDASQVLQTRMASGETPEMFSNWPNQTGKAQAAEGFMLDLTGDGCIANINDKALELTSVDGKNYFAPMSYNTTGIYYNKKTYEELGLKIPNTWDELIANCDKIVEEGLTPFTFQSKNPGACRQQVMGFWVYLPEYRQWIEDCTSGNMKADDENRYNALYALGEDILKLHEYAQEDEMGTDYDQGVLDFASGKSVMMPMGSWIIPSLKKGNPDIEVGMFPCPARDAEDTMAIAFPGDFALCISSEAENAEMCKKFVEYMTRTENATYYAEKDGSPSCIKGVDTIIPELKDQYKYLQESKTEINPDVHFTSSVKKEMEIELQRLIMEKDIDVFIQNWSAIMEEGYSN